MPLDPKTIGQDLDDTTQGQQKEEKLKVDPQVLKQLKEGAQAELYAQMAQDPDFAAVIRSKQQGKKIKVVEEGQEQKPPQQSQKAPEEMSEKEKLDYIISQVGENQKRLLEEHTKPLREQVEGLTRVATQVNLDKINSAVETARKKYADFATYEERMAAIAQGNKNLTIDQLYILAKGEKGEVVLKQSLTSSERPSSTTARSHERREVKPGVEGARDLIRSALNNRAGALLSQVPEE